MVGKRKRGDTTGGMKEKTVNGDGSADQIDRLHRWLVDVVDILNEFDTRPSIFDRPIVSVTAEPPSNKRAKLSDAPQNITIASNIETNAYTTVEEFVRDLDIATSSILNDPLLDSETEGTSASLHHDKQASTVKITVLKRELDKLVVNEMLQDTRKLKFRGDSRRESSEELELKLGALTDSESGRRVLTLYGGDRTSKQLFSSIAEPKDSGKDLNEHMLPNGITTSRVMPVHSLGSREKKKAPPTLGELFAPPSTLPPLNPPKQSKHTSTRSSSVNWYNPSEAAPPKENNQRKSYFTQPLSTGRWLTYSVAPSPTQLTSPETKRRQRDRALSFGEPQVSVSQETLLAHKRAKEDALFRSVYSSFAPDRDDTGALVAEQQKNYIWWNRYGESDYGDLLDIKEEGLARESGEEEINPSYQDEIDDNLIKDAVTNWIPQDASEEFTESQANSTEAPESQKEADDLLQEISELLETLNSHQRVRNISLPTNTRSMAGQSSQLATMSGSPSSPSSAEFDVYETLRDQLALVVSTLPPYLLAKLDGNRLAALNITTKIQVEAKNQRGTMEDDEITVRAAVGNRGGLLSASQAAGAHPGRSNNHPQAASTPAQRYPGSAYPGQPAVPRQSSNSTSYPPTQAQNRPTPSSQYPSTARPPYTPQASHPSQRVSSSPYLERYTNGASPQNGQQPSQPSYSSYGNGHRPTAAQNASAYSYNQQYSTPQSGGASAAMPVAQGYRGAPVPPPPPAYKYGYGQGAGSASPHGNRSSLSGQGQGPGPQRPQLFQQHSSHHGTRTSTPPQSNGTGGLGAEHMTADEQATLMNKQKDQLGEQQQRQGSGTPQPASGQYMQPNGTPTAQQNGVIAGE